MREESRNALRIPEIFDPSSGEYHSADVLFGQDPDTIHTWRRELRLAKRRDEPLWVCSLCQEPVFIAGGCGTDKRRHHFKHYRDIPLCPYQTRDGLDADTIRRIKYNGAKESPLHRELKEFLRDMLELDPDAFNIMVEQTHFHQDGGRVWRRPDVATNWRDRKIVFEIQISTDFLTVILGREEFYHSQEIFLLWVFNQFSPDQFTTRDIYVGNQKNLYVLTERTKELSLQNKILTFECHYKVPYLLDGQIVDRWQSQDVCLKDLTFDKEKMQIIWNHYDEQVSSLSRDSLRSRFERYWCNDRPAMDMDSRNHRDELFKREFAKLFTAPNIWHTGLENFLYALYSLRDQTPVYYKMNLFGIVDNALNSRKEFTHALLWALHIYGHSDAFRDRPAFKSKVEKYKAGKDADPKYKRNKDFDPLFAFLFPDLKSKIT